VFSGEIDLCYDPPVNRFAYNIATVLGLGDRLPAPGTTAGSLPAIVGWWIAMVMLPDRPARLTATLTGFAVVFVVGVWVSALEARRRGADDPGPVVIDEVAGQWLTVVPALVLIEAPTPGQLGLAAAAGFLLFRVFDVAKPWPVRRFEAVPGGLGIMVDDVAAAVLAAVPLAVGLLLLS
jgi:phosphatidylglycerophosphatase A